MSRLLRSLAAVLLLAPLPAAAKDDYLYGPAPNWAVYRSLGEAAIRAVLADPAAWAVEWPNGYAHGVWPMKGHPQGYVTCGLVHALRPVEGGYPSHWFAVVIDHGAVKGIDYKPKPANSVSNLLCQGMVQRGALPPASMMVPAAADTASAPLASAASTVGPLGIAVRAMPDGAYVTAVAPGSPAAAAGLKPGMVIMGVNAVPLAGLGEAMSKVVDAADASAALTLVDGRTVRLGSQ